MRESPLRVVAACVVEGVKDDAVALRAAAAVVDGKDGALLAHGVAFLTRDEADLSPRPDELALRGAMAALPGLARGILEALVVGTPDASVARRIGQDLGVPTVAAGGPAPLPGWGVEEGEARAVAEAGMGALARARALLRG